MKRLAIRLALLGSLLTSLVLPAQAKPLFAFSPLFPPVLIMIACFSFFIALLSRAVMRFYFPMRPARLWLITLLTVVGWILCYSLPFSWTVMGAVAGSFVGYFLGSIVAKQS
jgi:hypothetical protein